MMHTYNPTTETVVSHDLYTGKTYSSTNGGSNNRGTSSSRSSKTSSSSCSICHGTGMDPYANESAGAGSFVGSGLTVGYTNHSGNRCPYCTKTSWHQHVYCPKCNANKHR